jgi:hypothetical protein
MGRGVAFYSMERSKKTIIITLSAFLFLVLGTGLYWYLKDSPLFFSSEYKYEEQYTQIQSAISQGNYDDAITSAPQLIVLATSVNDKASANILLADALFFRNETGDRQNAATLLKAIVTEDDISPAVKANAYTHMASWSYFLLDPIQMKDLIFNSPPYDTYLSASGGNIEQATMKLLAMSQALYPSTYADYLEAEFASASLLNAGINIKDPSQIQTAQGILQDVTSGDALFSHIATSTIAPGDLSYFDLLRSMSLGTASRFLPSISTSTVDASYDNTIAIADSDSQSGPSRFESCLARLMYSASLDAREHNLKNEKIKEMLDYIAANHTSGFDTYMLYVDALPKNNPFKQQVANFLVLSPNFAAYNHSLLNTTSS